MSDATGSGDTGNPTGGDAPGGGVGADALNAFDWQTSLGAGYEEHKGAIEAKGWKQPGDVLKAYGELESKLGDPDSLLRIPGENASDEDRAAFNKRLGVPDAPDGYEFKRPEDVPYNDDMAAWFRETGHKLAIPADKLSSLHDAYFEGIIKPHLANQAEQRKADEKALEQELATEWPDEQTRGKNIDTAKKAARWLGLDAEKVDKLNEHLGDFALIDAMRKVGELVGEDALVGGGGSLAGGDAEAELKAFMDHPDTKAAYSDAKHPKHQDVRERYEALKNKAYPIQGT